jgi:hypothetical protein
VFFGWKGGGVLKYYNSRLVICTKGKCHNPSLGFATKVRACKGTSQEGSLGATFHAPKIASECEGMNHHTPKWAPTLGVGIPMDSQMFKERLQGSKPIGLKSYLYHWKDIETYMSKMCLHDPFEHLKQKLWPKERSRIKLAVWLLTIKSQELTWFPCV